MKNLPEDELFNSVENRLRNYSELPDDEVWNRIAGAMPSEVEPGWITWTNRTAATLSVAVLFLLFYKQDVSDTRHTDTSPSIILGDKEKAAPEEASITLDRESSERDEHSVISNNSKSGPAIGTSFPSGSYHAEVSETVRSNSMPRDKNNDTREDVQQSAGSRVNDMREDVIVTPESNSESGEAKELKKESATSFGHVLPPPRKRKKSKLTFYSMISPSFSFQHVTPNSEDGVVVEKINSPGVISHERFGFSVESGIQGQISERFQYIVGFSYYQQSQQISYEEKSDGAVIESGEDLNYEIKPATVTRTFDYSMNNVGVQAGLLYTLKQRGLMHKAGVIFQYQMGLMKSHEGDAYDNSSSDYLNYQLVYRVEYAFRSGIGLFVQPSYTHSFIANESLNSPFEMKQSRAGLGVGIVYRF